MDNIRNFIFSFTAGISNCSLYSKDHPSVEEFSKRSLKVLAKLLGESGKFEIMLLEDELVINRSSFKDSGLQVGNLKKRLKRRGISRIEFLLGLTFEELRQFIQELLETDTEMPQFPHIKTGVLDIRLEEAGIEGGLDSSDIPVFLSEQMESVKELYKDISFSQSVNVPKLNQVVGNFVNALKRKGSVLQLLSHPQFREEYSYVHATNVSVLSIFQMGTLGVKDGILLRDIGLAGLLHDVGKLFISEKVLRRTGSLDEEEWTEIKRHPILGARFLSSLKGLPPLVPIVAFQHHLKYDGRGYPERRVCQEEQHICSQVVSISDCFDALRSSRPYRKGLEIKETLKIMKKDAKSAFNPFLLENFIRRMAQVLN